MGDHAKERGLIDSSIRFSEGFMIDFAVYSLGYAVFNVIGATIVKTNLPKSGISSGYEFFIFLLNPVVIIALLFIFVSMFFGIKALSIGSFTAAAPYLTGINFVLTVIVGMLYFGERLNIFGYCGIVAIFFGIVMVSFGYTSR